MLEFNMNKVLLGLILISCLFYYGCASRQESGTKKLTISAAASLKEPLEKIIEQYEKETNNEVNINIGGSGSLQKQIEEGAPVDLFISAGKSQIEALIDKGLADKDSYKELLSNSLVLIVSSEYDKNIKSMDSLKDKDITLALGEAETVPVGQYSKEYLENVKLWERFQSKIVYAKDVRAVLNYVEKGEAEAGIVYFSDAVNLKNSYIAFKIPEDTHKPIVYPIVVMDKSNNKAAALDLIKFMEKPQVREIFKSYNFNVKDN